MPYTNMNMNRKEAVHGHNILTIHTKIHTSKQQQQPPEEHRARAGRVVVGEFVSVWWGVG